MCKQESAIQKKVPPKRNLKLLKASEGCDLTPQSAKRDLTALRRG